MTNEEFKKKVESAISYIINNHKYAIKVYYENIEVEDMENILTTLAYQYNIMFQPAQDARYVWVHKDKESTAEVVRAIEYHTDICAKDILVKFLENQYEH